MSKKTVLVLDREAEWYTHELARTCPEYQFIAAETVAIAMAHAGEAEILVSLAPAISPELISAMPKLEWVQALTTGVDNLLAMPELPTSVSITNCSGFHGPQMSELAFLFMLGLSRDFPRMNANQKAGTWQRWPQPLLYGKTVCLLGLGSIAEALARRCVAFEMNVTGVSDGRSAVDGVSRIYRRAELRDAAAECDFLVVIVPYSAQTHHIVAEDILTAMKPGAFVINIARGGCVDEVALLAALRAGQIAGAGLDVFETEPLPSSNPLWTAPNTMLTSHIGGMADIYKHQALPLVARNLAVFAQGAAAAIADSSCRK